MPRILLSLGSSLGPRSETLRGALARLPALGLSPVRASSLWETEPVGEAAGPGWYLNLAAVAETDLDPLETLQACLEAERQLGRVRGIRGGPRTIDIDLLAWEQLVLEKCGLTLPHPRLHERRFVLAPLAEIAPDWRHPVLGLTVTQMLAALGDPSRVRRLGPPEAGEAADRAAAEAEA